MTAPTTNSAGVMAAGSAPACVSGAATTSCWTGPVFASAASGIFSGRKLRVLDLFSGYTIREGGVVTSRFGREIKAQKSSSGYLRVELWQNGIGKKYLVHRLLAQAFIPNPDEKPQVNHIDGDKRNNALSNLEWVTQSENQKHAYETGLQKGHRVSGRPISAQHKAALCGSRWAGQRRIYHAEGEQFKTPEEAASRFGLNRQSFYNRANSENFPSWKIEVRQEVK